MNSIPEHPVTDPAALSSNITAIDKNRPHVVVIKQDGRNAEIKCSRCALHITYCFSTLKHKIINWGSKSVSHPFSFVISAAKLELVE